MLGFALLLFCRLLGFLHQQRFDRAEPDAEPAIGRTDPIMENVEEPNTVVNETTASSSAIPDDATHQLSFAIPTGSTDLPTPEGSLRWLIL